MRITKKYDKKTISRMIRLYEKGEKIDKLSENYNIPKTTIYSWVKRNEKEIVALEPLVVKKPRKPYTKRVKLVEIQSAMAFNNQELKLKFANELLRFINEK